MRVKEKEGRITHKEGKLMKKMAKEKERKIWIRRKCCEKVLDVILEVERIR